MALTVTNVSISEEINSDKNQIFFEKNTIDDEESDDDIEYDLEYDNELEESTKR